ncbi:MAG TPA: acetyltransferase [Chitinophagaceae bacterium]|jgi:sugar O-acyltransferase (sialic acid O-acetyltransferase NeuD family)|nr:acetyltransferase [Chitinophagaceae bacterium]
MDKSLVLVGGGGHCRSCIDVIESSGTWRIRGILDRDLPPGSDVLGYPVLGSDEAIAGLADENHFLITVGQVKQARARVQLFESVVRAGGIPALVLAASARLAKGAAAGNGTIIMHGALLNAGAQVGANCILNTFSLIEHDCRIGDHTHISTGAIVNGGCSVGSRVFIGSGAVLAHGVSITDDTVIGAGSVVIRSVSEPGVYAGNPARKIS